MSNELPYNGFRKPPEWDELIEATNSELVHGEPYSIQLAAARTADNAVRALEGGDVFDSNRYYALSKAACYTVKVVTDERRRPDLIESASWALMRSHLNELRRSFWSLNPYAGLRVGQGLGRLSIRGSSLGILRDVLSDEHYKSIDVAERLVMNTLAHPDMEAKKRSHKNIEELGQPPADYAIVEAIENTLAGAGVVVEASLKQIYKAQTGKKIGHSLPISKIVTPEELEHLDLVKAGAAVASLRLDEIGNIEEFLQVSGPPWKVNFDNMRKNEINRPGSLTKQNIKRFGIEHESRLRCPALHVTGAIPFVMRLVPQIIARTQRQLLSEPSLSRRMVKL